MAGPPGEPAATVRTASVDRVGWAAGADDASVQNPRARFVCGAVDRLVHAVAARGCSRGLVALRGKPAIQQVRSSQGVTIGGCSLAAAPFSHSGGQSLVVHLDRNIE